MKDAIFISLISQENSFLLSIKIKRKAHTCPQCGKWTRKVHDYRTQKVKHVPLGNKTLILSLSKRRYRCSCGKRFYEKVEFLPKYHRMTRAVIAQVLDKLKEVCSFKSVAKEFKLSPATVMRLFDWVSYKNKDLPEVLSIDEFRGNTWGEKYQCILTDPVNKKIVDILPTRYSEDLKGYFNRFDTTNTKVFVSDMWSPYADICKSYFHKAKLVIDKFHVVRQVTWAFESVRKQEQKQFSDHRRKYFKRSKSLLTKPYAKLTPDERIQVGVMLQASEQLLRAYVLKEQFFEFLSSKDRETAKNTLSKWIFEADSSGIAKFQECAKTMINWNDGILNYFESRYTNGYTEGVNNKIKVLKRTGYGYRNFRRFRNRILHIFG